MARDDSGIIELTIDADGYIPGLVTHLSNKLSRSASNLFRRHFGIGVLEWRILAQLAIAPDSSASRLCAVIGLDKGAASRGMQRLGVLGLVAFADDGRVRRARLTPAGRRLHDRMLVVALERERRQLAPLDERERSMLHTLLARLEAQLPEVNRTIAIPPP
jgi:DNA-binding MarR family transcriptional regulator